MKQNIVITALGKDRPGIVAAVTQVLYEAGCNLEDSSMTILEGEFAMILVASLPEGIQIESLNKKFEGVRKNLGLSISLKAMSREETQTKKSPLQPQMISVYGLDQSGIVYRVAELLAKEKVNITDVNTKRVLDGKSHLYMMMLEVEPPSGANLQDLQTKLEALGKELAITVTLHPIETPTL